MTNLNGSRLVSPILLSIIGLLIQGCASHSQNKSESTVSLKNLYDQILETKLASIDQVESIVGKLSISEQERSYSTYAGLSITTQEGYVVNVNRVRVRLRKQNINEILLMELQIKTEECLEMHKVALEYGSSVMEIADLPSHLPVPPGSVLYGSNIVNDWGYVRFGFDSQVCLKTMTFHTGKPYKGRSS